MAYLDHAATTPMLPEAVEALTTQLGRVGNASSLHAAGPAAATLIPAAPVTPARANASSLLMAILLIDSN